MIFDYLKQNSHNYTINRYHNVSIKAQLGFGEGQDGGAVILTVDHSNFSEGDVFYVLLSKIEPSSNKIVAKNIFTDSIMVQNIKGENIAILECLEPVNLNIAKYRKYKISIPTNINAVYAQHYYKPKKFQMGFGEGEIIQKVQSSDVSEGEE